MRELDFNRAIRQASNRAGPVPDGITRSHRWHDEFQAAYFAAIRPKADLIRCVFQNPHCPLAFPLKWRTSAVVDLARTMYESRDFAAMPILADALEEAGCEDADILTHCRGDGPHVRGCWVVDGILGT